MQSKASYSTQTKFKFWASKIIGQKSLNHTQITGENIGKGGTFYFRPRLHFASLRHWFCRWLWEHFTGKEVSGRSLRNSGTPFPHIINRVVFIGGRGDSPLNCRGKIIFFLTFPPFFSNFPQLFYQSPTAFHYKYHPDYMNSNSTVVNNFIYKVILRSDAHGASVKIVC